MWKEPGTHHNKYDVKVVKDEENVTHIPRLFSKTCFFLFFDESIKRGNKKKERGWKFLV